MRDRAPGCSPAYLRAVPRADPRLPAQALGRGRPRPGRRRALGPAGHARGAAGERRRRRPRSTSARRRTSAGYWRRVTGRPMRDPGGLEGVSTLSVVCFGSAARSVRGRRSGSGTGGSVRTAPGTRSIRPPGSGRSCGRGRLDGQRGLHDQPGAPARGCPRQAQGVSGEVDNVELAVAAVGPSGSQAHRGLSRTTRIRRWVFSQVNRPRAALYDEPFHHGIGRSAAR